MAVDDAAQEGVIGMDKTFIDIARRQYQVEMCWTDKTACALIRRKVADAVAADLADRMFQLGDAARRASESVRGFSEAMNR